MSPIVAAGVVVSRRGPEVLLVHRPKYDDWSFPKGKLDPGEHLTACAVREVAEETGLDVRLGPPLSMQSYRTGNGEQRDKVVHYWAGRVVGGDDVTGYQPNVEIDDVRWVPVDKARGMLSYPHDLETLEEWFERRKKTHPLVVLRHASAVARKRWEGDDRLRPLDPEGDLQAEDLVPVLAAYGVSRVVSSTSTRCTATVAPYADVADLEVELSDDLTEEEATGGGVEALVESLLEGREPTVLCTHRPVLPHVLEALGLPPTPLAPGEMLVVHHRRGRSLACEVH
ncbi:MAG: NUDIX hydrolase [Nocardioidaceae bacterium]